MTTMWVVLGGAAPVMIGTVGWRDRARAVGAESGAAGQEAQSRQHRYEVERHSSQGGPIYGGQPW